MIDMKAEGIFNPGKINYSMTDTIGLPSQTFFPWTF
jgi:hypothetical protein